MPFWGKKTDRKSEAEEETQTWAEPPKQSLLEFLLRPHFHSFFFLLLTGLCMLGGGFLAGVIWARSHHPPDPGVVCVSWREQTGSSLEKDDPKDEKPAQLSVSPTMRKPPQKTIERYSFDHMQEQTIFNSFRRAILAFKENNDKGACLELKNIIHFPGYSGQWHDKAKFLFQKNCYKK